MKMAATWRLFLFQLFFQNSLETWYIYRFSGSASLLVFSVCMWDWKRGCGGHFGFINFNKSFLFSINCLETWHIESLHQPRGIWVLARYSSRLIFIIPGCLLSPTWSCVSLTRSTTSSEWKIVRLDKMKVHDFGILLIDDAFFRKLVFEVLINFGKTNIFGTGG